MWKTRTATLLALLLILVPATAWCPPPGGVGVGPPIYTFKNIAAGGNTVQADVPADTLTLSAGTGISIASSPTADSITVTSSVTDSDTTYNAGNGISLTGTTFAATASTGITVNSTGISVDTTTLEPLLDLANIGGTADSSQLDSAMITAGDMAGYCTTDQWHLMWNTGGTITCDEDSTGAGAQNTWYTLTPDTGTSPVPDAEQDTLTITGGTGVTVAGDSSTDTITLNTVDSEIVHDNLSGFVANEHIDWTTDQGATNIDSTNVPLAATATALAANGANCAAGEIALGVDASGAVEGCYEPAFSDVTGSTTAGQYGAATIDGDDIASSVAGRSLTLTAASPDTLDADTELYTDTKCIYFEDPTASDDFNSIWKAWGFAATITGIWCESDQTVNLDLQIDDGTPADVAGTDLVCSSSEASDTTSLTGSMADGDELDLAITSVSGTPTWVSICWQYTKDD